MNALILDGFTENHIISHKVSSELNNRGWSVEIIHLSKEKIATCMGCFGCWLKTPGICILGDKGQDIAKKVIQSHLMVLVTQITFGGYSYHLKKMVDRFIPNVLPFFINVDGEIHHQKRYEKNPDILAIGYLSQNDPESELIFRTLIKRNSINFHSLQNHVEIVTGDLNNLNLNHLPIMERQV